MYVKVRVQGGRGRKRGQGRHRPPGGVGQTAAPTPLPHQPTNQPTNTHKHNYFFTVSRRTRTRRSSGASRRRGGWWTWAPSYTPTPSAGAPTRPSSTRPCPPGLCGWRRSSRSCWPTTRRHTGCVRRARRARRACLRLPLPSALGPGRARRPQARSLTAPAALHYRPAVLAAFHHPRSPRTSRRSDSTTGWRTRATGCAAPAAPAALRHADACAGGAPLGVHPWPLPGHHRPSATHPPQAVSRSRFWGTPMPLWVSDDYEEVVVLGSIAELEEATGEKVRGWLGRQAGGGGAGFVHAARAGRGGWAVPSFNVGPLVAWGSMHSCIAPGALPISCRWRKPRIWQQIKWRSPHSSPPRPPSGRTPGRRAAPHLACEPLGTEQQNHTPGAGTLSLPAPHCTPLLPLLHPFSVPPGAAPNPPARLPLTCPPLP